MAPTKRYIKVNNNRCFFANKSSIATTVPEQSEAAVPSTSFVTEVEINNVPAYIVAEMLLHCYPTQWHIHDHS